jgi:hypothetical protein
MFIINPMGYGLHHLLLKNQNNQTIPELYQIKTLQKEIVLDINEQEETYELIPFYHCLEIPIVMPNVIVLNGDIEYTMDNSK